MPCTEIAGAGRLAPNLSAEIPPFEKGDEGEFDRHEFTNVPTMIHPHLTISPTLVADG